MPSRRKSFVPRRGSPASLARTMSCAATGAGIFVCISPWNFPLAIFSGQVAAALAAGNVVVAKPAEQTPRIAAMATELFHAAGGAEGALVCAPGDGALGAALVSDPRMRGVAFTGSVETAQAIQRALAARGGADRAADRRDRRDQRHDRRFHRLAGTGDRRCPRLGLPLRRPALLGPAPALPAGRHFRAGAQNADRRRARIARRRSARARDPCRPGHRFRGQGRAGCLSRADAQRTAASSSPEPRPTGTFRRAAYRGHRAPPRPEA